MKASCGSADPNKEGRRNIYDFIRKICRHYTPTEFLKKNKLQSNAASSLREIGRTEIPVSGKRSLYCPLLVTSLSARVRVSRSRDSKQSDKEGTVKRTFTQFPHSIQIPPWNEKETRYRGIAGRYGGGRQETSPVLIAFVFMAARAARISHPQTFHHIRTINNLLGGPFPQ